MYSIQEAYKSVEDFNTLAGNLSTVTEERVLTRKSVMCGKS